MAETGKIAEQAEILASELFSEFFWEKIGPINQNWPCEDKELHGSDTHPTDVVYYYDEPYAPLRTYVQCDLKSYAKGSIKANAVKEALVSLAKQVACANKSEKWRGLYMHEHKAAAICGLLFVYNHDGGYDKDFGDNLRKITPQTLNLSQGTKLFVLGPRDIFWLDNIRDEIQRMRGKAKSSLTKLPDAEQCRFFYPQLARYPNVQVIKARAATLELLTSPIIMMEHRDKAGSRKGVVVFYSRKGESVDEFVYLIDLIRQFQLLACDVNIVIKTLGAAEFSPASFEKAQQRYIEGLAGGHDQNDLGDLVKAIRYEPMTQVKTVYSEIALGMSPR